MSEVIYALVHLAAEVHAIPGTVTDRKFISDRAHEYTANCDCKPAVFWHSSAAPKPLYEHRNAQGQLSPDEAKTH